jgi:hypothetical protein
MRKVGIIYNGATFRVVADVCPNVARRCHRSMNSAM